MTNENTWKAAFLSHNLKGVSPASMMTTFKTFEKYIAQKFDAELSGKSLPHIKQMPNLSTSTSAPIFSANSS